MKGSEHLLQERQMKYQFILDNIINYPVERMCKCMKVSKNSYYHWMKFKDKIKEKSGRFFLKERIKSIFEDSRQTYGSYRMQKMLEREELFYSRSYIAVVMREMGLKSVLRKKYVVITDSDHSFQIAENKLDRDFSSLKLGQKWVSDITYIRVNDKWNYLTTIMDLADRKKVGWSLSEGMTTEQTIMKAWHEASKNRAFTWGFIYFAFR